MSRPRILFIDAYDSFTNNIISLIETELAAQVTTIRIDADIHNFADFIKPFDAIVAGPGPGNPTNPEDVGHIARLWSLNDPDLKPVLGICLGFQSLVQACGGRIGQLPGPRHGISTVVQTQGNHIFDGLKEFRSIQYHSLYAGLRHDTQAESIWDASQSCPALQPLAWDLSDSAREPILMAVKHNRKPFYGIQFHPESICSSKEAKMVIKNWWRSCQHQGILMPILVSTKKAPSTSLHTAAQVATPYDRTPASRPTTPVSICSNSSTTSYGSDEHASSSDKYSCVSLPLGPLNIPGIVGHLRLNAEELLVLDSECRLMPGLGRYSIIALTDSSTAKLSYRADSNIITIKNEAQTHYERLQSTTSVFTFLKNYVTEHGISKGHPNIPFWGGLIGYITYEACLETVDIPAAYKQDRDDVSFAFVERSIVIDHVEQMIYVQSIRPDDAKWIAETRKALQQATNTPNLHDTAILDVLSTTLSNESAYKAKIAACQQQIRRGNSYELCLTNQATFTTSKSSSRTSWQLYQRLRQLNPAPFASYLHLGGATILSTSPERFMHWSRPVLSAEGKMISTCQFRPIKGTVQKRQQLPNGAYRTVSLEEATSLLSTPKETAENLMIVDLIRHDLHGVVGSGNVRVASLMQVEEYESVYQLVSVIEGDLEIEHNPDTNGNNRSKSSATGIDVLAASLPPGSMTGAPKKRSCELLKEIEDEPRSIYSGVIGYMCVGGGGDFSVVIRTVFKWNDEDEDGAETWRIGAGGAVTTLSTEQDEWEEMLGKLGSTRRLFE